MYGIPNMKLDKRAVVERRIKLLEQEGIKFICNATVGENVEAQMLLKDFDATLICTGATQPRDLPVEGRKLGGVHFAMEYLTASTKALLDDKPDESPLHAKGKDVIVIGGGDTGTDCIGTALRQGCRSLLQIEIMPKSPAERAENNPWPEWPKIHRMDYAQEEAIAKFGQDPRTYLTTVKKFVGDADGQLESCVTVEISWAERRRQAGSPGTAGQREDASGAAGAAGDGFHRPRESAAGGTGLQCDARSNVQAEYGKYATSVKGVYAAGDCRRGQSLIVWAINEGREAAREVDRYLMGHTDLP